MKLKDFVLPCRVSSVVLKLDADGFYVEWPGSKGNLAVAFVTGETVGSKSYDKSDPVVRRIETNADLYVTLTDNSTIDYVRKSVVDAALEKLDVRVLGVVVARKLDSVDSDSHVRSIACNRLAMSALWRDLSLMNYLASRFLKKSLLPVLLVYLAVLLANFFIYSNVTSKLADVRSEYAKEAVELKKRRAVTQAQERLFSEYDNIPEIDFSFVSDEVASVVPKDMRLTLFSISSPEVKICGDAFSAETVMSFVEKLRSLDKWRNVNVVLLEKDKKENLFRFEIRMML